ncbi:protein of unknown function [Aminobacter niigataensis]|nr:protein of unknown function [Aminobacter niigataensis]
MAFADAVPLTALGTPRIFTVFPILPHRCGHLAGDVYTALTPMAIAPRVQTWRTGDI